VAFDRPLVHLHLAFHHGQVLLVHLAVLELLSQAVKSLLGLGQYQRSSRFGIEPVDHTRAALRAWGQRSPGKQCRHNRGTFLHPGWMDRQTPGLVDHHKVVVFPENRKVQRPRLNPRARPRDLDDLPRFEPTAGLYPLAPQANLPPIDQALNQGSGNPQLFGEEPIDPVARLFRSHQDAIRTQSFRCSHAEREV